MSNTSAKISKIIGKTIFKNKMIEENDRILAAISGGKDSMTMLYDFRDRQKRFPIKFQFEAIHIQSDFCTCCSKSDLIEKFKELDIIYHIVDIAILKRVKPGQTMNCYWCSSQRRMELMKFARENGFNKIALGHHLDDIVETLLMNMFLKGQISGMLPVMRYDNYPVTVIRPLAEVKEDLIIEFAKESKIDRLVCKCPYGINSKRKEIRNSLKIFTKGNDSIKYNIYKSMNNIKSRYLTGNADENF
jgi:tRNA 2-thiocytidine biosynthesis protein TtcA